MTKQGYQRTLVPRKNAYGQSTTYTHLTFVGKASGSVRHGLTQDRKDAAIARGETFAPTVPRRIFNAILRPTTRLAK